MRPDHQLVAHFCVSGLFCDALSPTSIMSGNSAPMGAGSATGNSAWTSLPPYPGEEPSLVEAQAWIEAAELRLVAGGHGPLLRGETPPALAHLAFTRKTGLKSLSKDERAKAGTIEAARYDQMVAKAENDELIRQEQFRAGMSEHKDRLAAMLMAALRPNAGLRLRALRETTSSRAPRLMMAPVCGRTSRTP